MKPVWLLDVDGVINKITWEHDGPEAYVDFDDQGSRFKMRWNTKVVDTIRYFANSDKVDIRWCTTWVSAARNLEDLWMLPRLDTAFDGGGYIDYSELKNLAAVDVLTNEKRPLIWTDDDVIPHDFMDDNDNIPDMLLIRPRAHIGLSNTQLELISEFITDCLTNSP